MDRPAGPVALCLLSNESVAEHLPAAVLRTDERAFVKLAQQVPGQVGPGGREPGLEGQKCGRSQCFGPHQLGELSALRVIEVMQQPVTEDEVAAGQEFFELKAGYVADQEPVLRMLRRGGFNALGAQVDANVRRTGEQVSKVATTAGKLQDAGSAASAGFAVFGQGPPYDIPLPFVTTMDVMLKAAVAPISHPVFAEA